MVDMDRTDEDRAALVARLAAIASKLAERQSGYDEEIAHSDADDALLGYISDPLVTAAYNAIGKWYA